MKGKAIEKFVMSLSLAGLALGASACSKKGADTAAPTATETKGAEHKCGAGKCGAGKCGGEKATCPCNADDPNHVCANKTDGHECAAASGGECACEGHEKGAEHQCGGDKGAEHKCGANSCG